MLKKSIHGFFSHDLREVNSRKSFKSLDTKSSRHLRDWAVHPCTAHRLLFFSNPLSALGQKGVDTVWGRWYSPQVLSLLSQVGPRLGPDRASRVMVFARFAA